MKRSLWILVAILSLAAALRFFRLGAQSFWNDEGTSARVAERSLPLITAAVIGDIHPPLYYYALHFWRSLWGESEFALRGLSAALGVFLVWLIYLLGRQFFGEATALVAALIAAVNPFQVYYSQEARMYAMLAVWAATSTCFLVRWLDVEQDGILPCVGYALTAAAGMYTHYAFPFILAVHNLAVIGWLITRNTQYTPRFTFHVARFTRRLLSWVALQITVVVLYLPWLSVALRRLPEWKSPAPPYQLGSALLDTFRWFVFGRTILTASVTVALGVVALFVLASLVPTRNSQHTPRPTLLLFAWWLIPIVFIFALGLYKETYLKFLLVSSPAFCLLFARGIVVAWSTTSNWAATGDSNKGHGLCRPSRERTPTLIGQIVVILLLILVALLTVQSLSNLYFDPDYARDNYRGIAQHIQRDARPGDAVLLEAPNQWETFTYYHRDNSNVIPLARFRPVTEKAAADELSQITAKYKRLFVLYWAETEPDPNRYVERWLNVNTYKASESSFGAVRLAMYAVPAAMSDRPDRALGVRFGASILLQGYSLLGDTVAPGDILQLALFWQAETPIATPYKVFVHVLDAGDRILTQADREPGGGLVPTTIWQPGQTVIDRYGLAIPPDAPPGRYRIAVGLYGFDGVRLDVRGASGGDRVVLGEVNVTQ